MKLRLDKEELYPYYIQDNEYGTLYEINPELWGRYTFHKHEFLKYLNELEKTMKEIEE